MDSIYLLNNHVNKIILGGKPYSRARVLKLYNKLSTPRVFTHPRYSDNADPGNFYNANRVDAKITPGGDVSFMTYYPEAGKWSYSPPENRTSPIPYRGMIEMSRAWNKLTTLPDGSVRPLGAGLYTNSPISNHRAKSYLENSNFISVNPTEPETSTQIFDNRRFKNSPVVAELLMRMDAAKLPQPKAQLLREQMLQRFPQLREVVETIHLPAAGVTVSPRQAANTPQIDYYDAAPSWEQQNGYLSQEEINDLLSDLRDF